MAESIVHSDSVRIGVDYIKTLIPSDLHCLIQSDLPEIKLKPERTVENFVPDIRLDTDSLKIIGEAKTDNDTTLRAKYSNKQPILYFITQFQHFV